MPISVGLLSSLLKLFMNIGNNFNGCEITFNSSFLVIFHLEHTHTHIMVQISLISLAVVSVKAQRVFNTLFYLYAPNTE